jgi:hypothetical protein
MGRLIQVSEYAEELQIFGTETNKRICISANDGSHPHEVHYAEVVHWLKHIVVIGNGKLHVKIN